MSLIILIKWRNSDGWHTRGGEVGANEDPQERLAHLALTVWEDIKNHMKKKDQK